MTKSILIGTPGESSAGATIDEHARARSIYILGIQGTGKSTVLEQIAHQDMVNGDGLLFIDPHGDSVQKLLERVPAKREQDVIVWNPSDRTHPIGINPFYCPNPNDYDAKADSFVSALAAVSEFAEIFKTAPQMKNILHHLAICFVVNQGHTLIETPRFLQDEGFRLAFYPKLDRDYPQVRAFWEQFDQRKSRDQDAFIASTLNKLQRFGINRTMQAVFGQPVPKLKFKQVMDDGRIVLVFLNREKIGPDNAALVGSFIVSELLQTTLARIDTRLEERRPFHVIADEFQTFATTAFPTLIEEGRKYRVDVTLAHQVREQLAGDLKELTRAVGNIIVFRVTAPNAEALAGEFKANPPKAAVPLVSDPWEYLRGGRGHTNSEVYSAVTQIRRIMDEVAERYAWEHEYSNGGEPRARVTNFHQLVGRYLYRRMKGQTELPFLVNPEGSSLGLILRACFSIRDDRWREHHVVTREATDQARKVLKAPADEVRRTEEEKLARARERLDEEQAQWERAGDDLEARSEGPVDIGKYSRYPSPQAAHAFHIGQQETYRMLQGSPKERFEKMQASSGREIQKAQMLADRFIQVIERNYQLAREFVRAMEQLGDLLSHEPITTTAQTYEMPRTFADLRAETADRLTNLEKFHALCKLETNQGIHNVTIITEPLAAPASSQVAAAIIRRSQEEYGASAPRSYGTIKNDGRVSDDNPNEFGESKASSTTQSSANG